MTALDTSNDLGADALHHLNQPFVAEATLDAAHGFQALRDSGTLPPGGSITIVQRIPDAHAAVTFADPGPWNSDAPIEGVVSSFDDVAGDAIGDLVSVLAEHPEITTIAYVRSPYLLAWARSGRPLPIRYVPVQRWTLAAELPIHTGQARELATFIIGELDARPHTPAVLDANGGAVVWGTGGLLATLEYLQLVEEGAQVQVLAQSLGGSLPVGPGVLLQQWKMSGLEDKAREQGLLA
ncbi:MAG: class aldolase/adducin-like protein [Ilumatobacteraceae bacterium]|nr:class aldolase/adducin-like protein [Ilumatobacteraceae bacterium]